VARAVAVLRLGRAGAPRLRSGDRASRCTDRLPEEYPKCRSGRALRCAARTARARIRWRSDVRATEGPMNSALVLRISLCLLLGACADASATAAHSDASAERSSSAPTPQAL